MLQEYTLFSFGPFDVIIEDGNLGLLAIRYTGEERE